MVQTTDQRAWVSLAAAARRLEIHPDTARRIARDAQFSTQTIGKRVRFSRDEIERYVASRTNQAAPPSLADDAS
jgi:Helix-turn-helix domain